MVKLGNHENAKLSGIQPKSLEKPPPNIRSFFFNSFYVVMVIFSKLLNKKAIGTFWHPPKATPDPLEIRPY